MRLSFTTGLRTLSVAALLVGSIGVYAQEDPSRAVQGGGISAPGWEGKVDSQEAAKGLSLKDAKFAKQGDTFQFSTGPAVTYWNPANKASGNYTVKATFKEPKFMNRNDHPHPYGIVIGGNDMGTDQQSLLYCSANGNGNFIVRGFGPAPFQMNARGTPHDAIHKAGGPGQSVTQEIALSVNGDKVECSINGTVVGSYNKSDLVTSGKLKSTDGIYGLRFSHNTEGEVSNFTMTKN